MLGASLAAPHRVLCDTSVLSLNNGAAAETRAGGWFRSMRSGAADVGGVVESSELGTRHGAERLESRVVFPAHRSSALGKSVARWRSWVVWASVGVFSCCLKTALRASQGRTAGDHLFVLCYRQQPGYVWVGFVRWGQCALISERINLEMFLLISFIKNANLIYSSGCSANKIVASQELRLCRCTNRDLWFSECW